MNFFTKKLSESLKTESKNLEERGLPKDSFFHVHFKDGSDRTEHDLNWSEMSEKVVVDFFGQQKVVAISVHPIVKLRVKHGELETEIEVNSGEKIYQAMTSQAIYRNNGTTSNKVIGRIVGKVKDGKVIEERFIDGRTGEITGLRV